MITLEQKVKKLKNNIDSENRYPKRYRAEYIYPGIVSYEDSGAGKVLVLEEALNRMKKSFIGKPAVNFVHKDLTAEEAFKLSNEDLESLADGVVSDVGIISDGERKGWHYADLIIWDEATKNNIDLYGFSVSCAYTPSKVDSTGGKHNNIEYDEEVLDGIYDHMAIVEHPRYEQAKIYENSKNPKEGTVAKFKFFSKKENAKKNTEEEAKEVDMKNSVFVNSDGEEIPMEELEAAYKAKKKNEIEEEEKKKNAVQKINAGDEVEIDGKKVKANDLYNAYKAGCAKQNAEPATDEDLEKVVDEQKQNSLKNSGDDPANFKKIQNAINSDDSFNPGIQTRDDRLKHGHQRYSKTVKQEVKS
jgi:hypothetical protein